jgi:hypothetical protein
MTFRSFAETDLSQDSNSESFTNFDFTNINNTATREVFAELYDGVTYPELDENTTAKYHQIFVITGACREANDRRTEAVGLGGCEVVGLGGGGRETH